MAMMFVGSSKSFDSFHYIAGWSQFSIYTAMIPMNSIATDWKEHEELGQLSITVTNKTYSNGYNTK